MAKRKIVPSLLTSMNLLCGFVAILINEPISSFYLILVGIAFDFVDGLSARVLKVPSAFGKELDSLADMVSFGVAPGFLYYHHILKSSTDGMPVFLFKLFIATLIPVMAGLRLAKFNVRDSGKTGFSGLPSSAAALFIISIPYLVMMNESSIYDFVRNEISRYGIPLLFALLMVTNIPMFNFKNFNNGIKGNWVQITYLLSLVPVLFVFGLVSIPVSIGWYIIWSVIMIRFWRN